MTTYVTNSPQSSTSKIFLLHHNNTYEVLLADFLSFCGFSVLPTYAHQEALALSATEDFDMCILDLNDEIDLALIQSIQKQHPGFPIIALTHRDSPSELVKRSELPIDQVVTLPIPLADILEAVNKVFSSSENFRSNKLAPLTIGSLQLDIKSQKAFINHELFALTSTEFSLIELLAENFGQPVPKDVIYPKVLGRTKGRFDRSIDVHVSSIRHKLQEFGCHDVTIESVRGVGYRLACKNPSIDV